ncbi:Arylesterase precursor [hydrothermal vent metagenome]|uniref:Arylesterase n=1 Tax=hydrothermal vent metagenome TaxID=652676 RepID=A0A3B1AN12_9ZZZZ
MQSKLKMTGFNHKVINVSVSGDTTRTGLNRLKPLLAKYHPDIVIVALGGNDGLRGLAFSEITTSLGNIILMTQQFKSKVLLAGVRLPPNYGAAYNSRFTALFKTTADKFKIRLVPSLLSGIDDKTELMQPDKIHPKAQAQSKIVDNVWQELRFLLR